MSDDKKTATATEKKEPAGNEEKTKKIVKKKGRKVVTNGNAYIKATFNNTVITITDLDGGVLTWATSGSSGFKGSRKSTPYAAQVAAENAIDKALIYGIEAVNIFIKGVGSGREQAIRGIQTKGIDILSIIDTTPIPHNGCRKKKLRRV